MTSQANHTDTWSRTADELPIVLVGGPADGHWYHRDDFEERQRAAGRMAEVHHRTPLDPASWPLSYAPTSTVTTHHRDPNRRAVQWTWTGPAQVRSLRDLARLDAEARTAKTDT